MIYTWDVLYTLRDATLRGAVLVFRIQAKPVDDNDTLNNSNLYTLRSSVEFTL